MSYEFYKILHIWGLLMASGAIGAIFLQSSLNTEKKFRFKGVTMAFHGVGILAAFVAGFGLAARTGLVQGFPTWLWFKLGILVAMAIAPSLAMRVPVARKILWVLMPILLLLAIVSVVARPLL